MAPSLISFCSAFILDETSDIRLFICSAVSKLRASDWRQSSKIDTVIVAIFSVANDFKEGAAPKC